MSLSQLIVFLFSKKKKHIIFPPNKLLMFLLLMTSSLNLNCLKFNNQSSLFLSLFLIYHLLISTIKPTSYLYLSLNSSYSSSQKKKKKKHIIFPPNKLLIFLLLMTSPLNLNCLKFNTQSSLSLSLSL